MIECKVEVFEIQGLKSREMSVDFSESYLNGDGGGLFLREPGLCHQCIGELSNCFEDVRDQRSLEHRMEEMVAQCGNASAVRYEDFSD